MFALRFLIVILDCFHSYCFRAHAAERHLLGVTRALQSQAEHCVDGVASMPLFRHCLVMMVVISLYICVVQERGEGGVFAVRPIQMDGNFGRKPRNFG